MSSDCELFSDLSMKSEFIFVPFKHFKHVIQYLQRAVAIVDHHHHQEHASGWCIAQRVVPLHNARSAASSGMSFSSMPSCHISRRTVASQVSSPITFWLMLLPSPRISSATQIMFGQSLDGLHWSLVTCYRLRSLPSLKMTFSIHG